MFTFVKIDKMKEKLEILMADTGLRVGEIAMKLSVKAPVISHILSGRNQPNFALTAKIISTFNQYNPYWWLGSSEIKLAIDSSAPSVKDENQNVVYFALNSSDLDGDSKSVLAAQAEWLKANLLKRQLQADHLPRLSELSSSTKITVSRVSLRRDRNFSHRLFLSRFTAKNPDRQSGFFFLRNSQRVEKRQNPL